MSFWRFLNFIVFWRLDDEPLDFQKKQLMIFQLEIKVFRAGLIKNTCEFLLNIIRIFNVFLNVF